MEKLYAGIDLGTTQTKIVVYNKDGVVRHQVYRSYQLVQDQPGMAELKISDLLQAVQGCLAEVWQLFAPQLQLVSFSSAMHGLLVLDENVEPLTELLTFADTRAVSVTSKLTATQRENFLQKTGVPVHPMAPVYKIKWLEKNRPEIFAKAGYFVGFKDYLWYLLTGKLWQDVACGAATGLMKTDGGIYDEEILHWAGITTKQLPQLKAMTESFSPVASDKFPFLKGDVPFFIGGSDGVLANLGAVKTGNEAVMTMGTSGALRYLSPVLPEVLPEQLFCYNYQENGWLIGGASSNAGSTLAWGKERFFPETEFSLAITKALKSTQPPVFLPYLLGERAPLWQPEATGSFWQLRYGQDNADLFFGVILGILFNMKIILQSVEDAAGPRSEILANGGFFQTPALAQLAADVLQRPLIFQENNEASALGAVKIAAPELTFKEAQKIGATVVPKKNYQKQFQQFVRLLTLNEKMFADA
ncbi:gluconokinase [Enterococcus timonensis]|uniref:gluconokinase n=1 Tax=Enterococcus timonensis TaxID=1852364 RepID=UPI0008D94A44|nr:gluconokinase [Enterococcus timonensis]